ncbi:MAG: L,D-transpeptidase [Thermoleophilaceae bacterium]
MRVRASLLAGLAALSAVLAAPTASGSTGAGIHPAAFSAVEQLIEASAQGGVLAARTRSSRPRPHRMAVVRGRVPLSTRPRGPARLRVGPGTEFGSPRVLGVAARRGDWLGVVTTERPNNRLAWVHRGSRGLQLRRTKWSLHADLSSRILTLRRFRRPVLRLTVAVGRPGSETPTGRFAVTDKLSGARFGPYYGCCILALSGKQPNTPPGWTGGNRLAIHGTDAPATIGAASSAGCLRATDADLRLLMRKVPLGTPVFIRS